MTAALALDSYDIRPEDLLVATDDILPGHLMLLPDDLLPGEFLCDSVEVTLSELMYTPSLPLPVVVPVDWDSMDLGVDECCYKESVPDRRDISTSAAELRAMDDEQFYAYFEFLTGRKY